MKGVLDTKKGLQPKSSFSPTYPLWPRLLEEFKKNMTVLNALR